MIIDAHTHIGEAGGRDWGPRDLVASMDDANIAYSLLISADVTNAPLEKVLEVTQENPRLKAIGHVSYKTLDDNQINKLIGHLDRKEIHGIKLYPGYENYFPFDEKLHKLFTYCEDHNHPIVVHTGVMLTGFPGYLEQVHPLPVDRLATNYPKLNIVMAHMGNPWLTDAIAVMWKNPNVYADLSAFFTEFQPIDPQEADFFLNRMSEVKLFFGDFKKFLFGTDWPLYTQKEYVSVIERLGLEGEEKELVMWKNAARIFNLDVH